MAFNITDLVQTGLTGEHVPRYFVYTTSDNWANIPLVNYFNDGWELLRLGDIIRVVANDGIKLIAVSSAPGFSISAILLETL